MLITYAGIKKITVRGIERDATINHIAIYMAVIMYMKIKGININHITKQAQGGHFRSKY